MSQNELLPCPFCGGEPEMLNFIDDGNDPCAAVQCKQCGAGGCKHVALMDDARPSAAASWNRRIEAAQAVAPGGGEVPNPVQLWGDTGWHELNGWKLVPIEPTPAMCVAGFLSDTPDGFDIETPADAPSLVYRAMLAAAPASEAKAEDDVKLAKELQRFYPWVVTTGNGGIAAEMVPAEDGGYVLYNEAATKLAALSNLLNDMRPKPAASEAKGTAIGEWWCERNCDCVGECQTCHQALHVEQEQAGEIRSMNFTPDMWNPYEILRLARRSLDGAEPLVIDRVDECIRQEPALLRRAARVEAPYQLIMRSRVSPSNDNMIGYFADERTAHMVGGLLRAIDSNDHPEYGGYDVTAALESEE